MKTINKGTLISIIFLLLLSPLFQIQSIFVSGKELTYSSEAGKNTLSSSPIPENTLRIHYKRDDHNYENLGLWLWEDVEESSESKGDWPSAATPFDQGNRTEYGIYLDVPIKKDAKKVGFLVVNVKTGDKDGGDKVIELFSPEINEIWIKESDDHVYLYEPVNLADNTVRIHYQRSDQQYDEWNIWTWGDVASPSENWPFGAKQPSGVDHFGAYYDVELKSDAKEIGFLFVNRNGDSQTMDYTFPVKNERHLFIYDGDAEVYTNPYGLIPTILISGEVLSEEKILLRFTSTENLVEEEMIQELNITDINHRPFKVDHLTILDKHVVEVYGEFDLESMPFTIRFQENEIRATGTWRMIDELYGYTGELGPKLHADGTATLKVWAPKADNVEVILYDKDDQFTVVKENIPMNRTESGVWEVHLNEEKVGINNLRGYFYHYQITHGEEMNLALDPYAKSMAAWANEERGGSYSIGKGAIVDPSMIGPTLDFAEIEGYENREDAIIYEVHVRDFTSDPSIADELEAQFGTFASFVEKLDYIESLGVTHIQLLPVMSYYWVNEWESSERLLEWSSQNNNYNWGYDPHSYFSLTGMYSEDPNDPELRIEEFKQLIYEIHRRGMGVILDVVYNHTAKVEIFENLVPNYYHFMDADGTPRESFGGGRLGTTHQMARRILVDSIKYWVDEFKVDGFRFDMMGDHDAETIQLAYDEAKKLNPNILMIGEGWRTYVGDEGDDVLPADQDWMQYTDSVGVFSDEIRNELKSGYPSEGEPRFITGGPRNIQQIFDNITANPHNFVADDPGDVVQYIAAHDNLTLHDVIAYSIKKDPDDHQEEIHRRIRLGNAMILTAQGTVFLHAGQEFGRTKQFRSDPEDAPYKSTYMTDAGGNPFKYPYFIHDSYDSTDAINKFDWQKATNNELYPINVQTREYTKGLIRLRRSTDAFRLGTMDEIQENVQFISAPEIQSEDLVIAYQTKSSDRNEEYYIFVNADDKSRTLSIEKLPLEEGEIIVDRETAGTVEIEHPVGVTLTTEQITIDPLTTIIIRKMKDQEDTTKPEEPTPEEPPISDEKKDENENNSSKNIDDEEGSSTEDQKSDETSGEEDTEIKDEQDIDRKEEGKHLPNTATNIYNWIFIGVLLILISGIIFFIKVRDRRKI